MNLGNQPLEVSSSGTMGSDAEDPIVAIRVSVDQVVFNDGSEAGEDSLGKAEQMGCKPVIDKVRRHLLRVYQAHGLDALLQELKAN